MRRIDTQDGRPHNVGVCLAGCWKAHEKELTTNFLRSPTLSSLKYHSMHQLVVLRIQCESIDEPLVHILISSAD